MDEVFLPINPSPGPQANPFRASGQSAKSNFEWGEQFSALVVESSTGSGYVHIKLVGCFPKGKKGIFSGIVLVQQITEETNTLVEFKCVQRDVCFMLSNYVLSLSSYIYRLKYSKTSLNMINV